jgi:DNA-binding HxlR family transcriptional regulator
MVLAREAAVEHTPRDARREKPPEAEKEAQKLDGLVHERVRLGILCALAVNPSLPFTDLKTLLDTTAGNLSVHARKLEEAGYVSCKKFFRGRTPQTEYRITAAGRKALEAYLGHMEAIISATRSR